MIVPSSCKVCGGSGWFSRAAVLYVVVWGSRLCPSSGNSISTFASAVPMVGEEREDGEWNTGFEKLLPGATHIPSHISLAEASHMTKAYFKRQGIVILQARVEKTQIYWWWSRCHHGVCSCSSSATDYVGDLREVPMLPILTSGKWQDLFTYSIDTHHLLRAYRVPGTV